VHNIPPDELPRYPRQRSPRISSRVPPRVKLLRAWRDRTAERLALNPALVLNRALIKAIAVDNPKDMAALESVEGIHQWQVQAFGKEILQALK
jgi:ribonuclease D